MPCVSYGMIVLNGQPFIRYNLRALYPFAHELIVVEGATEGAESIASEDGHSTDGTLDVLADFQNSEDPENKLKIITREGFWKDKDEQSQAYSEVATGDFLWQVDVDEFYKPEDVKTILEMLDEDGEITAVSFKQVTFWGSFDVITDSWYLRRGAEIYHRLFKWGDGYHYSTHRPPTVVDPSGLDLRTKKWIDGYQLADRGIYLYHYSLVFPRLVKEKCMYYRQEMWGHSSKALDWYERCYLRLEKPFRVHNVYNYPSWLEDFKGQHPPEVERLKHDSEEGRLQEPLRHMDDAQRLLGSYRYRLARAVVRFADSLQNTLLKCARGILSLLPKALRKRVRDYRNGRQLIC